MRMKLDVADRLGERVANSPLSAVAENATALFSWAPKLLKRHRGDVNSNALGRSGGTSYAQRSVNLQLNLQTVDNSMTQAMIAPD